MKEQQNGKRQGDDDVKMDERKAWFGGLVNVNGISACRRWWRGRMWRGRWGAWGMEVDGAHES